MNYILSNLFPFLLISLGVILAFNELFFNVGNYKKLVAIVKKTSKNEATITSASGIMINTHCANILYEYQINDKVYIGSNIYQDASNFTSLDPDVTNNFLDNYSIGKKIQINVMKKNPEKSYILEGRARKIVLLSSYVSIFSGILLLFMYK